MTESRADMIERHKRELAELESRWWEEWFTEDPVKNYIRFMHQQCNPHNWIEYGLPTIIRKREKIGVTVECVRSGFVKNNYFINGELVGFTLAEKLAGRTLAPGERVDI